MAHISIRNFWDDFIPMHTWVMTASSAPSPKEKGKKVVRFYLFFLSGWVGKVGSIDFKKQVVGFVDRTRKGTSKSEELSIWPSVLELIHLQPPKKCGLFFQASVPRKWLLVLLSVDQRNWALHIDPLSFLICMNFYRIYVFSYQFRACLI